MRRNPSILAAARRFIQRSSGAASTCGEPTVSTHEAPVVPLCAMVRLRRDPSAGRRAAGIVAVCVVGAPLVVFAFRGCVLYELSVNGALAGEFANVDESFGSVWAQIAIDAVLMAAVCLAVDAVARYFGHAAAARSLRTVYRGWLMLVVLVAFMVTAAVGYVVVTFQEEQAADELMGSEPILSEYASEGRLVQLVYSDEDMLDPSEEDRIYSLQIAYLRVGQVDDYLVLMIQPASMVFADRAGVMVWLTLSALVLLLVVFAASSRLLVRIVADPIDRVNRVLERIAEGDLATRTDEGSSRELASLSEGVNTMTVALEKQFSQIKEGIKRELDAAAVIQESALPRAFPPFPDIPRFDIYAGMQPAREVGGDFYDFFLIGDACNAESGKLGFVVADVSGKGVPAALLDDNLDLHPRELIELVRRDVMRFSEGAEQADDITMLALEFGVPSEVTATITVPADDRELPHVTEFVHTELDRRLCPVRAQRQLDIALEELFVNVAHYAYPDATPDRPGEVRVSYTYSAEPPSITVEIEDEGIPFDPLSRPDAVTPTSIEDVPIGGLGILMAKRSVDEMRYERTDGTNVVTITKRW